MRLKTFCYFLIFPSIFKTGVENIWHTELDFLVPHRDRLVILSFTTSPYQNNSIQEENFVKQQHRPMFIDDDDELSHTHLIEKFHSGTFDEHDYFDTHEKLENERTTVLITTPSPVTASNNGNYDTNKMVVTTPNVLTNVETNEKQIYGENAGIPNGNNRKQHARTKNRNNGGASGGRGSNRKNSNANRERFNDNMGGANRKEKNNRGRGDEFRENIETKVNNNYELDKNAGEFGERGGNTKSQKKYVTKIDTDDELPPDHEFESNGNRKSSIGRDSNIHVVKPVEGAFVPSTPFSTDSKIIEIRPSTVRTSKRIKRSSETIDTRMQIESERIEDEFDDLEDEDIREPRIYVNLENNEQYAENDDNLLKPASDAAVAAALIDNTVVPANVTPITTTSKQLHGFVGCLQHYLNVNKEIGRHTNSHTHPLLSNARYQSYFENRRLQAEKQRIVYFARILMNISSVSIHRYEQLDGNVAEL